MRIVRLAGVPLLLLAGLGLSGTAWGKSATAGTCGDLAGLELPGIEITAARLLPPRPAGTVPLNEFGPDKVGVPLPETCRVEGIINRRTGAGGVEYGIGFALALPTGWNGAFLYQGGGGLNGSIAEPLGAEAAGDRPALARGFAVISTDSGHKGAVFDASFMQDQQAALDFAYNSVGATTQAGRAIATAYYGRPPERTYSLGCSTGGREAMLASQSYPLLFDGVVSGAPAMRTGHSNLALHVARDAFRRVAPKDASGRLRLADAFSAADRQLLSAAVARQCDGLDGLKDGIIANPGACRFDPAVLECNGKASECLSPAQVDALRIAFAGPRDRLGRQAYPGFPFDLGLLEDDGPVPGFLPSNKPSPIDAMLPAADVDVDARLAELRADDVQNMTDTSDWTNLGTFFGRGGKIIFYHGVSDPWFSYRDTEDYHARLKAANPAHDSSRLYLVPGMAHCRGGPALDRFDLLTVLVDWVEKGQAPQAVPASGRRFPGRAMPLCLHPTTAHYKGRGSARKAASFECRE